MWIDVEARLAGGELDHGLLALLLLGDLLGPDLDAGQVGEFLVVLLQRSPRGLLARITSSLVPAYFFQFTCAGRESPKAERAGRRGAGQNGAA